MRENQREKKNKKIRERERRQSEREREREYFFLSFDYKTIGSAKLETNLVPKCSKFG